MRVLIERSDSFTLVEVKRVNLQKGSSEIEIIDYNQNVYLFPMESFEEAKEWIHELKKYGYKTYRRNKE